MFDDNGYLPPGKHHHTTESMQETFVDDPLMTTPERETIFKGYKSLVSVLQNSNVLPEQWIGGTFVTTERNPNDVDIVSICCPNQVNLVPVELQDEFACMFQGERTAEINKCDSYIVLKGHEDHPKNEQFKTIYAYWENQFGHDKEGVKKGFVKTCVPPATEIDKAKT